MSANQVPSHDSYVSADQLSVGLYVLLDLPWFQHNFTLNHFRIRSPEQVRELRALKLTSYRIDTSKSDASALAALQSRAAPPPSAAPTPPGPGGVETDLQRAQRQRREMLQKRREQIANVDKAFGKAVATMKNLNRNLLAKPHETLEEMGGLVDQMIEVFLSSPEATLHVMADRVGGEEVYFHSLNITILAMMLAKGLGFDAATARDLGVGAMVHDIGLIDIPDRVLMTDPDELNHAERHLRMMHVEYGVKLGTRLGLSPGALKIIGQHHEFVDGSGYPLALKGDKMTEPARLVSLVNYYDNLCNPVNVKKAMTPHKALSHIYAQCRDKFDSKALQLMIRSLGVYPPGSIVHLSNDVLATVTSVNPNKPLRPWVMLYDERVPRDEAPLVNLELEPSLSITKSIAPGLLPPKALAYLNPRKRITYFFDGGPTDSAKPT